MCLTEIQFSDIKTCGEPVKFYWTTITQSVGLRQGLLQEKVMSKTKL